MGFKVTAKTARIEFDESSDYHGAEVRVSLGVRLGDYLDAQELIAGHDFEKVMRFLADQIVEWNIEDEDGPLTPDFEGLMKIPDPGFIMALLKGWQDAIGAVATVDLPFVQPSSGGGTSA